MTRNQGVKAKASGLRSLIEVKANAAVLCSRTVLEVEDSPRGPHPCLHILPEVYFLGLACHGVTLEYFAKQKPSMFASVLIPSQTSGRQCACGLVCRARALFSTYLCENYSAADAPHCVHHAVCVTVTIAVQKLCDIQWLLKAYFSIIISSNGSTRCATVMFTMDVSWCHSYIIYSSVRTYE